MSEPNKLPLRQKAAPPVLRYSTDSSPHKPPSQPVHLFSRNDLQTLKYSMPAFHTDLPRNDLINLESVRHAVPKPSDPYSRPFIPREPVLDRKTGLEDRFYDHRLRLQSLVTHSNGFQTNSFMRPKSAFKKEERVEHEEQDSDDENEPNFAREATEARSFVIFPAKTENTFEIMTPGATASLNLGPSVIKSLQRPLSAKSKSASSSDSPTDSSPNKSLFASRENIYSSASGNTFKRKIKINSSTSTATSSTSTVTASTVTSISTEKSTSTSVNVDVTTSDSGKTASTLESVDDKTSSPSTAELINKRPPTPRQRANSTIIKRAPVPPSSPNKVRNPRYTPAKPYDEVKDPKPETKVKPEAVVPKPDSKSAPVIGKTDDKVESTASLVKSKPPLPVTKKSAKIINEQRPEGDGAPSVVKKVEKIVKESVSDKLSSGKSDKSSSGMSLKSVTSENTESAGSDDDREKGDGSDSSDDEKEERLPGDGETSVDTSDDDDDPTTETEDVAGDDEDDEDVVDNLDDDVVDFADDGSDGISITSTLSLRSGSARSRTHTARLTSAKGRQRSASSARSRRPVQPGLKKSLFSGVPPTVNFVTQEQRVQVLPWEIRKMLKWRLSPITPNIVKSTVARSGFRVTKRNFDWIGCWGRHMKAHCFKSLRDYQKINHFPGTFQIGRKDRLWRNLSKLQSQHGKREFSFFPQTYVLPADLKRLKQVWDDNAKQKWIIKPPAMARGIGIKVIHKWIQIPKRRPVIVQKYLAKPYLINQSKFDLRIYVYVTSYDPLRIYIFEDGLVRFASQKYSSSMKHLNNKFMHLTNYSINKHNSDYQSNTDENVCQGHKWGLKALWGYLENIGVNTKAVWSSIKDVCIKCIISAESPINSLIKSSCRRPYTVHELFGFDIFLDDQLKPWIIEVNISPSLHSNSQLDVNIKGTMMKDLLNLAGFMIPDKRDVVPNLSANSDSNLLDPSSDYCINRRLWRQTLSGDEKAKHAFFVSKALDPRSDAANILETLTPDDVRVLVETLDEDNRRGEFERVFPSSYSSRYLQFFEQPRYYNLLVDAWVQKYHHCEQRGINLLETLCQQGLHTDNPTMDPAHQWSPNNQTLTPRTVSAPARKPSVRELPVRTSFVKKSSATKLRRASGSQQTFSLTDISNIDSKTSLTRVSTSEPKDSS